MRWVIIAWSEVIQIVVTILLLVAIALFLRTRTGVAMRATAFDQETARAQGVTVMSLPPSALAVVPVEASPSLRLITVMGEACRLLAHLLAPVAPSGARAMLEQLGNPPPYDERGVGGPGLAVLAAWGGGPDGWTVGSPSPLFPRVELEADLALVRASVLASRNTTRSGGEGDDQWGHVRGAALHEMGDLLGIGPGFMPIARQAAAPNRPQGPARMAGTS